MLVTCYGGGFDFEALKFSGVAAVLPAAFFPYHRFCNKERMTAADRATKFILVLGKISNTYIVTPQFGGDVTPAISIKYNVVLSRRDDKFDIQLIACPHSKTRGKLPRIFYYSPDPTNVCINVYIGINISQASSC